MNIVSREFKISGMHCFGCEDAIVDSLSLLLPCIVNAEADYRRQTAKMLYNIRLINEAKIRQRIEAKGYGINEAISSWREKALRALIFLLLLVSVGSLVWWGKCLIPGILQQINPHMSCALLLGIGFLTGFYCIGMCGSFLLGYTNAAQSMCRQLIAHLVYGFGKTLSYCWVPNSVYWGLSSRLRHRCVVSPLCWPVFSSCCMA
jgi:copper chaperone CopZ